LSNFHLVARISLKRKIRKRGINSDHPDSEPDTTPICHLYMYTYANKCFKRTDTFRLVAAHIFLIDLVPRELERLNSVTGTSKDL